MKKILIVITKLLRQASIGFIIINIHILSAKAQQQSDGQQWTGAWSSDGSIHVGDLNGDGKTDVFMWKDAIKSWSVNISTGTGFNVQNWTHAYGTTAPIHTGDLNGDKKTDIFFWDNLEKVWRVNLSTGSNFLSKPWSGAWGSDGPINVGDLNGDGNDDVFMWRDGGKDWTVNISSGSGFTIQIWHGAWGSDGQIQVGDLNGDRKDDVFMWNNSMRNWSVNLSTGADFKGQAWNGADGAAKKVLVGDLNADKKTDVIMWSETDGWQINLSTGNAFEIKKWAGSSSSNYTKTGDFNGDGKMDVITWQENTKEWKINFSTGTGFKSAAYKAVRGPESTINAGDLNGDGKTDIFMWREADRAWTVNLNFSSKNDQDLISHKKVPIIDKKYPSIPPNTTTNAELFDISPDTKNGTIVTDPSYSTAGLTLAVAGDKNALYAVSMNAGVWKTEINESGGFAKWNQLQNSPRYSSCIAVDPQFPGHIAVGEREGDAKDIENNNCGLWESFDGGQTFDITYYLDPLITLCPSGPKSHAITAVLITDKSTTLAASPCGLGRREYLKKDYSIVLRGNITALSYYQELIVARSLDSIFISEDDGFTWPERYNIQTSYNSETYRLNNLPRTGFYSEGLYSVAILKSISLENSFVYIPATRSNNDPNKSSILIFNRNTKTWTSQNFVPGLGTGLGGRAFIKSFYMDVSDLPNETGGNSQLIYCASQDLSKAKIINPDGTVVWELFASSGGSDSQLKKFHSDIWDFHIDPLGWYTWVANDGGVFYRKLNSDDPNRLKNLNVENKWAQLNEGLHTHHIHSVVAASERLLENYTGFQGYDKVSYSTSDNQAWKNGHVDSDPSAIYHWKVIGGMGDVNYSFMDCNNTFLTLNVRIFSGGYSSLDNYGTYIPPATLLGSVEFSPTMPVSGQQGFHFIQSLSNETVPEHLDALVLVNLPLTYGANNQPVNGVWGQPNSQNRPVILRNKSYSKSPSTGIQNVTGWYILFDDLPIGVTGFWVSGGHLDPTIFILVADNNTFQIRKRKSSETSWTLLPSPASRIVSRAQFGPLFVNPFDPSMIYVACTDGIYYYDKTQNLFLPETRLTELISENGKYSIAQPFNGGKGGPGEFTILGTRANAMGALSSMAFNPDNPDQIVCSSPFTGVFYKDGSKPWRDLSYLLPRPFTPISSLAFTSSSSIYVATEGRGLFLIKYY